jgi:hypothetical protein
MLNLGIRKLLPSTWKAVAWIDADIEFESPTWAKDTLRILNGTKDIVQVFSHCLDMDEKEETMNVFSSFGHQYIKGIPYNQKQLNYWHPGYAWACTRKAYEKMGGLYEPAILGSADNIMSLSLVGKGLKAINENSTDDYKQTVIEFQNRVRNLRLGYVPGIIRHYFHGSKKNRKYGDRWQILLKHDYSPTKHVTTDKTGILVPTNLCPQEMLDEIMVYFKERNEDEFYENRKKTTSFEKLVESISMEFTTGSSEKKEEDDDDTEYDNDQFEDDTSSEIEEQEKEPQRPSFFQRLFSALQAFMNPEVVTTSTDKL